MMRVSVRPLAWHLGGHGGPAILEMPAMAVAAGQRI